LYQDDDECDDDDDDDDDADVDYDDDNNNNDDNYNGYQVLLMIQKERIAGTRMPDGRRTAMCPVLRAAIVLEAAMAPRRKAVMGPGGETVIVHRTLPECTCEERESRYQSFSNPITVIEEKDSSLRIEFHKVAMVVDNSSSPKNNTARSK